ncbi:MAG: VCBS domain-containing protein [Legionellaceae bacterium]|nr:VCBS domain-containing protein [Legionellaceae bacterium]
MKAHDNAPKPKIDGAPDTKVTLSNQVGEVLGVFDLALLVDPTNAGIGYLQLLLTGLIIEQSNYVNKIEGEEPDVKSVDVEDLSKLLPPTAAGDLPISSDLSSSSLSSLPFNAASTAFVNTKGQLDTEYGTQASFQTTPTVTNTSDVLGQFVTQTQLPGVPRVVTDTSIIGNATVPIIEANAAANISRAHTTLAETNVPMSTGGVLTSSDVDSPTTFVAQTNVAGANGVFNIGIDGAWTYVANSAFDNLNSGQSVSDQFNVASADGTVTTVQVTINGANDAAVLSSASATLSETNAALSTGGTLTITDVDNPATYVAQTNVAGTNGVFNIGANGAWTYVANSAFDNLNVGQSVSDQFNVASADGTVTTVQVTINGTNDAPVAQLDIGGTIIEGSILTNSVNVLANDTDSDNSLSVAQFAQNVGGTGAVIANGINTITTTLGGTVLMNANGTYTYTAPANLNHSSNDTIVDGFFYKASDGSIQTAWTQVSINVTDTAPIAISDVDSVGFGGLIYGNVITGYGGSGAGADTIGADSTKVLSVQYNGTTYSNFAEVLASGGGNNTLTSWTNAGIEVLGYNLGTAIFGTSVTPSVRTSYGLYINSPGSSDDSNEIDSTSTTQSEAIALNMGDNYSSLQVTFRDVQSDDKIGWKAYDSNQVLVDSGIINNTTNGLGAQAEASFTISPAAPFQYIAFYGTDATDNFTLWSVSNGVPAVSNPSLTITADHGTLVFYDNGSYTYQSDETLTSAGGGNNLSTWTAAGVQVLGYNMGTAIFGASVTPSVRSGYGLFLNSPGTDDTNEIDSTSSTQTETIALNMGADYRSLQVTFRDVQSDDQISWKAYNSSQVLVDSGVINNTITGSGSANEASFTISPNAPFRYIAFSGTDATDNFTIWSISNGVQAVTNDVFTYTVRDADNDTSTSTLTIAHQGTVTAVADVDNVYESGLPTGTDPGHADIVATGNLFANDQGISSTSNMTQISFGSTTATPVNGVVTIDTPEGLLTVYTTTTNDHVQGDYQYTLQTAGDPVNETFSYRITDTATNQVSNSTLTINIVDDVHVLSGTSGVDTLTGGNYTDLIDAKDGNDTLFGGLGPDTLIGGQGSDTMTGGGGQDTFTWKSGDSTGNPNDTITDYTKGAGGDTLNLSDLLTGESQNAQSLDSYLNFSYNSTTNATTVAVDADGGATFNVTQTIVLAGVDLTSGGTLNTDQDILTTLIFNGSIKTDA